MSKNTTKQTCGIVMPISSIDGYTEEHWSDVLSIITESIETSGFEANLVSNADDVGIIQKRIIQNLYNNPVVVCDVSAKNPNVMFELGMRLAFDRPTIIVKDDKTAYSFDTSPIEHLEYPRDLRFGKIVEFKNKLKEKITSTYSASIKEPSYTTFLKHFGEFTVAKLDTKEVSSAEYILEELKYLRMSINRLERGGRLPLRDRYSSHFDEKIRFVIEIDDEKNIDKISSILLELDGIHGIRTNEDNNKSLIIYADSTFDISKVYGLMEQYSSNFLYSDNKTKTKQQS